MSEVDQLLAATRRVAAARELVQGARSRLGQDKASVAPVLEHIDGELAQVVAELDALLAQADVVLPASFADHPRSLAEVRAYASESAAAWKPRDVLIALLRDLDSGKIDTDELVVGLRQKEGEGLRVRYLMAGMDNMSAQGLLMRTIWLINQ